MNDLINPLMTDTAGLTLIEIALGIDENGMTTAIKLYEFLEMDKSQYARWVVVIGTFSGGGKKVCNVAADSGYSMIRDIMKQLGV